MRLFAYLFVAKSFENRRGYVYIYQRVGSLMDKSPGYEPYKTVLITF